jgi:hypothetical protein
VDADLTGTERAFVARAVRRRRLFLALSLFGVVLAVGLGGYYAWRKLHDPGFALGARLVIVVLVLLNSRQNLRQYRFAGILEKLARTSPSHSTA